MTKKVKVNKNIKKEADEFKKFISRGSVVDMAIGVIIGGAFGKIVSSLVNDIIMPLVGVVLGGLDFSSLSIKVGDASIKYGSFIQSVVDFLIIALCIFTMLQILNSLKEKADKYVIKSSTQAINDLTQLGETSQIQAVNIVTQNLCGRKEYSRALAICDMSCKNLNEEGVRQIRLLKRQIKSAKFGDLAQKMLTGTKSIEEREAEYESLKTAMKVEDIKPSQIPIGKINNGSVTVYLNKIWDDQKQR